MYEVGSQLPNSGKHWKKFFCCGEHSSHRTRRRDRQDKACGQLPPRPKQLSSSRNTKPCRIRPNYYYLPLPPTTSYLLLLLSPPLIIMAERVVQFIGISIMIHCTNAFSRLPRRYLVYSQPSRFCEVMTDHACTGPSRTNQAMPPMRM